MKAKITTEETTVVNQIDEIPIKLYMAKGEKGDPGNDGQDGADGQNGADGFSPTVETSKTGKVTTITITDVDGEHTATILDGADGQGTGDMLKATYDTNANGVVDNAEKVNNHTVEDDVPEDFFSGDATATAEDGTTVELTDAIKLDSVKLKGDTTQQTYTGKNLFNFNNGTLAWGNAAYQTHTNDANSCTMTATGTGGAQYGYVKFGPLDPTKTYTLSGIAKKLVAGSDGTPNLMLAYSISDDGVNYTWKGTKWYQNNPVVGTEYNMRGSFTGNAYYMFYLYNNSDTPVTIGESSTYYNLQLELGSTATAYEPYVGGTASPNPDYPQDIQVVTGEQTIRVHGKNLFNPALFDGLSIKSDGRVTTTKYYTQCNEVTMKLKPSTTYRLTIRVADGTIANGSISFSVNGSWLNTNNGYQNFTTGTNGIIVMKAGAPSYGSVGLADASIQLEEGTASTSYEPYQSQDYTVNLGSIELAKIGTYQDYIYKSGDDWYVHKEIWKIIADGSTVWTKSQYGTNNYCFVPSPTSLSGDLSSTLNNKILIFSDKFTGVSYNDRTSSMQNITYTAGNLPPSLWIRNNRFDTVEDLTAFCASTPITFYYVLATATDTQITDSTLIGQLEALENATVYSGKTIFENSGNLPAILSLGYIRASVKGIVEAIPTVNDATLKIQANGTDVATFTANASENVTANIGAATTSAFGVTKLSSSTSSTSTTEAATPSAVKAAYDLANGKQSPLTAGTGIDITNNTISVTNIRYGTSAPSSSEGNDGDIFIVYEE